MSERSAFALSLAFGLTLCARSLLAQPAADAATETTEPAISEAPAQATELAAPPDPGPAQVMAGQPKTAPAAPAPTPPAPAEAPAPDSGSAADETLLAELDAELRGEGAIGMSDQPRLSIHGFADFTFYKYFLHEDSGLRNVLYTNSAFAVGNLNVYLASNLGANWNSMAEIRFAFLPNGHRGIVGGEIERTDTSAQDYTNFGLERRTGSIMIERAFLEYLPTSWLAIRAGQWLTPYGIWNVDHGSPTIIPVNRPFIINYALLPEHQTGLQIEGSYDLDEDLRLAAILGLSNGRGPVDEYADLDENKALTTRLSATWRGAGTLQLGTSAYYGRFTDLRQSMLVNGAGARVEDDVIEQYDELALAADLLYKHGGFHFQAEVISSQLRYTDQGRLLRNAIEYWPDYTRYGVYGVTGYRFEWFGLMPYLMAEYFKFANNREPARPPADDAILHVCPGLNARPTANVTLKLQGELGFSPKEMPAGAALEHPLWGVQSQAAWAF